MQTTTDRITWRNGFRLNGEPAFMCDVQEIFEERLTAKNGNSTNCAKPGCGKRTSRQKNTKTPAASWPICWGSDYEYDAYGQSYGDKDR